MKQNVLTCSKNCLDSQLCGGLSKTENLSSMNILLRISSKINFQRTTFFTSMQLKIQKAAERTNRHAFIRPPLLTVFFLTGPFVSPAQVGFGVRY